MNSTKLKVSAPGRICLFGEHQDYLRLPVIPCAISLRVGVEGTRKDELQIDMDMPDIDAHETFSLDKELNYEKERDYNRSAVNVIKRQGAVFSQGINCLVKGNIPINSGTSSSSALMVAWIRFLMELSDSSLDTDPMEVARLAHAAEVTEFKEPGGMMDHYSTALGGVIYLDFEPETTVSRFKGGLGTFVLGDSCEPKDTRGILARVKDPVLNIAARLKKLHPEFSLRTSEKDGLEKYSADLSRDELTLLAGTVENHEITQKARKLLESEHIDHGKIGSLLNRHQAILRDILGISTPKIDGMLEAALAAGALGGKINGSGGGGCMFVYAPENPQKVAEAIEKAGGKAYIITPGEGVRLD